MSLLKRLRDWRARFSPPPLNEWYHVTFDDERVYVRAEPPGQESWSQDFAWSSVRKIVFQAEDLYSSDGIYVFTTGRTESYAIPIEAEGGIPFWMEVLRRGLFDMTLAGEANRSLGGMFIWPPETE